MFILEIELIIGMITLILLFLQTDFFKVYIDFVKNYQNSLSTLTELKKENAELRKFLKVYRFFYYFIYLMILF